MYKVKVEDRYDLSSPVYKDIEVLYPMPDGSNICKVFSGYAFKPQYVVTQVKDEWDEEIFLSTNEQEVKEFLNNKITELTNEINSIFRCLQRFLELLEQERKERK